MSTVAESSIRTLADLMDRLGGVPLVRIRFRPPPGTATERDVLDIAVREKRLCELVDGVLVEKAVGYEESILAIAIARMLGNFVSPRNLGHVTGEQGMVRLLPGLVRIPDVAFASWDRFPQRRLTRDPIPDLVPDLAVEVLSESNTGAEMMKSGLTPAARCSSSESWDCVVLAGCMAMDFVSPRLATWLKSCR